MDAFAEFFCLSFLGFYSLFLLVLVAVPLFRYAKCGVLNRRKQTRSKARQREIRAQVVSVRRGAHFG